MIIINHRDQLEWNENLTVIDLLDQLNYTSFLVTVTINGELIPKFDYEDRKIPNNASVTIFNLAHGG
jgi:thiamine biosynthesis protein ThiS